MIETHIGRRWSFNQLKRSDPLQLAVAKAEASICWDAVDVSLLIPVDCISNVTVVTQHNISCFITLHAQRREPRAVLSEESEV